MEFIHDCMNIIKLLSNVQVWFALLVIDDELTIKRRHFMLR